MSWQGWQPSGSLGALVQGIPGLSSVTLSPAASPPSSSLSHDNPREEKGTVGRPNTASGSPATVSVFHSCGQVLTDTLHPSHNECFEAF
jgi:hypothetical protein